MSPTSRPGNGGSSRKCSTATSWSACDGFRTFLSSSDPRVRESNALFLPTLTPKRSEFFAKRRVCSSTTCRGRRSATAFARLTQGICRATWAAAWSSIAGPRFGPRELYQTPLADMLPVIIDPNAELHAAPEYPEFRPRLTPHAAAVFVHAARRRRCRKRPRVGQSRQAAVVSAGGAAAPAGRSAGRSIRPTSARTAKRRSR